MWYEVRVKHLKHFYKTRSFFITFEPHPSSLSLSSFSYRGDLFICSHIQQVFTEHGFVPGSGTECQGESGIGANSVDGKKTRRPPVPVAIGGELNSSWGGHGGRFLEKQWLTWALRSEVKFVSGQTWERDDLAGRVKVTERRRKQGAPADVNPRWWPREGSSWGSEHKISGEKPLFPGASALTQAQARRDGRLRRVGGCGSGAEGGSADDCRMLLLCRALAWLGSGQWEGGPA